MDIWSVGQDSGTECLLDTGPTMEDIIREVQRNHLLQQDHDAGRNTEDNEEQEPVMPAHTEQVNREEEHFRVYKRRWYILALFSALSATQAVVYITFAPIAQSAEQVYGWSGHTIALVTNCGSIAFLLAMPIGTWLIDAHGLKKSGLIASGLIVIGSGVKCVTSKVPVATGLVYLGQIFNGFAGSVTITAAPFISAVWFPAEQRTTSIAVASTVSSVGQSLPFLLAPLLVPPEQNTTAVNNTETPSQQTTTSDMMTYLYILSGWSTLVFIAIIVYFPNKPPAPPSRSAQVRRTNHSGGLRNILRNKHFWILALAYALPSGVGQGWVSVLDINLSVINISQTTAGYVAFTGAVTANVAAIVVALFSDFFKARRKLYIICLYILGIISFTVFMSIYYKYIPAKPLIYITACLTAMGIWAPIPIFYTLATEHTFPTGEGITNGIFIGLNNIFAVVFLSVLSIPGISTSWMNWCLAGCLVTSLPLLAFFKENCSRLDLDLNR